MPRVGTNMGLQTVTLRLLNHKCNNKKKKSEREILPGNISRIKGTRKHCVLFGSFSLENI